MPRSRATARFSGRRSGRAGARYPSELLLPLGRDTEEPPLDDEPADDEVLLPLLEPPEGRDTADPLLPPLGFGRAPAVPWLPFGLVGGSWAANAGLVASARAAAAA